MSPEGSGGAAGRSADDRRGALIAEEGAAPAAPGRAGALRIPTATYRLQLGPEFGFGRVADLLPYLSALGVSDLYLSPIFRSLPGSEHGYDVTDPAAVDSELGGLEGFGALARAARDRGMGILLDTVPNHMAAAAENPWWSDVLAHGQTSRFAHFFDIDWEAPAVPEGRLLLAILGEPYAEALEGGAFTLVADDFGLWLRYGDRRLPLEPGSWNQLLEAPADDEPGTLPPEGVPQALARLRSALVDLPPFTESTPEARRARQAASTVAREAVRELRGTSAGRRWLERRLRTFVDPGAGGTERLDRLLGRQPYALVHWRLAAEEINYRRFFDIGDMVAVRADRPDVFEATHALVLRLAREGRITGLRIDHVDGLWDPLAYLNRLQRRLAEVAAGASGPAPGAPGVPAEELVSAATDVPRSFYVVVEKILSPGEELPREWPVCGTTGYDFLHTVQGVFIDRSGLRRIDAVYRRFTGREEEFGELSRRKKHQVMQQLFGAEIASLVAELVGLARRDRYARDLPADELEAALREVTANLPVYRTYVRGREVREADRALATAAVDAARTGAPGISETALDFLRRVLVLEDPPEGMSGRWLGFVMRWQQVTGPVTAKGLEDTSLYVHNPLVALNEVGSHPDEVATVEDFHRMNERRLAAWPHSLNATSTHDTKRSEDVRARLDALTELPDEWEEALRRWSRIGDRHAREVEGARAPDSNEQALLFQTLLGAWPLEVDRADADLRDRLEGYAVKALREAKVHTSWREVNVSYEDAVRGFVAGLLDDEEFLEAFRPLRDRIARLGAANSLGQALLTALSPGVPDCYRGTELWDFSLVDPDNRRPVDFGSRRRLLEELDEAALDDRLELADELVGNWRDGRIKLWLTMEAFRLRRREPALFREGEYLPLRARGPRAIHLCAFARSRGERWLVAAVPRLVAKLPGVSGLAPGPAPGWEDTRLPLPPGAPRVWRDLYTDRRLRSGETEDGTGYLAAAPLFASLPFAALLGGKEGDAAE